MATYLDKSSAVAEMGDRLATIGMSRKWGGAAVRGWVPTLSPTNTMWPGPRPISLPSGTLIHPTDRLATNVGMPCSSA